MIPEIPEGMWCQKAAARNRKGDAVEPMGNKACKWCLDGWITRTLAGLNNGYWTALDALTGALDGFDAFEVATWNDAKGRTIHEVNALIRKANDILAVRK